MYDTNVKRRVVIKNRLNERFVFGFDIYNREMEGLSKFKSQFLHIMFSHGFYVSEGNDVFSEIKLSAVDVPEIVLGDNCSIVEQDGSEETASFDECVRVLDSGVDVIIYPSKSLTLAERQWLCDFVLGDLNSRIDPSPEDLLKTFIPLNGYVRLRWLCKNSLFANI